jgi:hypothetical protein
MKNLIFSHKNIVILSSLQSFLQGKFKTQLHSINLNFSRKQLELGVDEELISEILLSIPMDESYQNLEHKIAELAIEMTEW